MCLCVCACVWEAALTFIVRSGLQDESGRGFGGDQKIAFLCSVLAGLPARWCWLERRVVGKRR